MLEFVEQENAFTLTLTDRLHDPDITSPFEFFNEEGVVSRQVISGGEEVELRSFMRFAFSFELLFVPL
jgi:hypothetical protein